MSDPAQDRVAAALALLGERYQCFRQSPPVPLKIGIHHDLRATGLFSNTLLSKVLHRHTYGDRYLAAVIMGTRRFDLAGEPCGEVTPEQRDQARETMARKAARRAERKTEKQAKRPILRLPQGEGTPA